MAEREQAREKAAMLRHARTPKKEPVQIPHTTRISTVIGLLESPTNRKWQMFLTDGPYWTYMANYIRYRRIFGGREDLVAEAVTEACTKIGKFLCEKRYVYPEEGKGYFRGFLKLVAFRAALDVLRRVKKYEEIPEERISESERARLETEEMQKFMMETNGKGLEEHIENRCVSERDLDVYDLGAKLDRVLAPIREEHVEEQFGKKVKSLSNLAPTCFSDDPAPSNYDPGSFYDYLTNVSKSDLSWLRKLQVHVLYIALGHLLSNPKEPAARREMLRLRYGLDMRPKDVWARPDFQHLSRDAFDVKMKNAVDDLRREVDSWWPLVSPEKNDFADENVLKLWRGLLEVPRKRKISKALKRIATDKAGEFE